MTIAFTIAALLVLSYLAGYLRGLARYNRIGGYVRDLMNDVRGQQ